MRKKQDLQEMLEVLKPFDNYSAAHDENMAKLALIDFFTAYKGVRLDKKLKISGRLHSYYSYYFNILAIRKALIEKRYANACNEILSLNYYEFIKQKRVYVALMRLYQDYLE